MYRPLPFRLRTAALRKDRAAGKRHATTLSQPRINDSQARRLYKKLNWDTNPRRLQGHLAR